MSVVYFSSHCNSYAFQSHTALMWRPLYVTSFYCLFLPQERAIIGRKIKPRDFNILHVTCIFSLFRKFPLLENVHILKYFGLKVNGQRRMTNENVDVKKPIHTYIQNPTVKNPYNQIISKFHHTNPVHSGLEEQFTSVTTRKSEITSLWLLQVPVIRKYFE
jgi:hypothetical protein